MNTMKFSAYSKKEKTKFFTFRTTGEIHWPENENPTKTEIINDIKESMAKEWTRGSLRFAPSDVVVKLEM